MNLTALGAQVAQRGPQERNQIGMSLLGPAPPPINSYIINGICYDTVAYVRFLLGAQITPTDLVTLSGQGWGQRFNAAGNLWMYKANIALGTAVLFRRPGTNLPFHVAISLGGLQVRGVNGNNLGAGWSPIGDCNLVSQLTPINQGQFRCGPGNGDVCNVWLSNL
jgi:hypothetical protein